jgi:DNA mismatch repair protein MutS
MDGFGLKELVPGIAASGAILHYVKEHCPNAAKQLSRLSRYDLSKFMSLDEATKRNLELTHSPNNTEGCTLIKILDHTKTAMGARLLQKWVFSPLKELNPIIKRQNAVTELKENFEKLNNIRETLKFVNDIERIIGRVCVGNANPRDLLGLKESLKHLPVIRNIVESFQSDLFREMVPYIKDFQTVVQIIEIGISKDAPIILRDGNVIALNYNTELDELRDISKNAKLKIAQIQKHEIEKTGIKTLKIKFNNVFGYYIEVSKAQINNVPDYFVRKQTLVNAERYITEELKQLESKILGAEQKSISLEQKLFNEIREKIAGFSDEIKETAQWIATIDVLASFSEASSRFNYIVPEINTSNEINIKEGRHPVVERLLDAGTFISNSTYLDNSSSQILLITGPNMAGKSTYIRQVALLVLMAQIGSHIPAKEASIGIVDRIFSRIGAYDDLSGGKSTFMVEMNEMANILNNATSKSLIILDEVGRGTSTYDGISIAWAIIEYLYYESKVTAKTLFATHYHELTCLENSLKGVKNFNIDVKEWNDEIMFLHKIVEGAADKSYGIHVGRLAGLPEDVIKRSKELLLRLESGGMSELAAIGKSEKTSKNETQMDLFAPVSLSPKVPLKWENWMKTFSEIDPLNLTPLKALNLLDEMVAGSKELLKTKSDNAG